jgi:hypothetical protein
MFGTSDEVRKSIFLLQQLAIFVPLATHFSTPTNVSDGNYYPTVE